MGLYLQPALGRAHPVERDSRSCPACAGSVARTIRCRHAAASAEIFRTGFRLNLLDENFPKDQLPLLKEWHIPFRLIGQDIARLGVKDPDIIPLLHRQRGVTFFTLDWDFFNAALRHPAYGLAWLDTRADDAAYFVRRLPLRLGGTRRDRRLSGTFRAGGFGAQQQGRASRLRETGFDENSFLGRLRTARDIQALTSQSGAPLKAK